MAHRPPCDVDEEQLGAWCYPRFHRLETFKLGDSYSVVVGSISTRQLPVLADAAGDGAHLVVKKTGSTADVIVSSLSLGDAKELLSQLRPGSATELPE